MRGRLPYVAAPPNFYFGVRSPIANDSPEHAGPGGLLARMANDALDEFAYPAAPAGQSCSLYRHRRGITARFSGWSGKQDRLPKRWLRGRAVSLSVNGASRYPEWGNVAHWDASPPGRSGRRRPWTGRANHTERIP